MDHTSISSSELRWKDGLSGALFEFRVNVACRSRGEPGEMQELINFMGREKFWLVVN